MSIFFYIISVLFIHFSCLADSQKIVAIVGDHAITEYDLDQKIRFTMFTQGLDRNTQPSTMYAYFINSVIDNDLVISRIKQNGGAISDADLQNGLKYMASLRHVNTDDLLKIAYEEYGLDRQALVDCIKDDMVMQMMFLSPLTNEIVISDDEIKQAALGQKLDYSDPNVAVEIRNALTQKALGQKAKQIVQSLRQSTFVEIKIK